jgi:hypothetical protein
LHSSFYCRTENGLLNTTDLLQYKASKITMEKLPKVELPVIIILVLLIIVIARSAVTIDSGEAEFI